MRKNRLKGLGLNLIAPGVGQFALKRFFRGFVMLFAALGMFFWACWVIFKPIYSSIMALSRGSTENAEIVGINFIYFGVAFAILAFVWGWSFLDIIVFAPQEES